MKMIDPNEWDLSGFNVANIIVSETDVPDEVQADGADTAE